MVQLYISACCFCVQLNHLHTGTLEAQIQRWYDVTSQEITVFIFCAHSRSNIVVVLGPLFVWQLWFVTSHWYLALHLGGLAEWAVLVWYISWPEVAAAGRAVQWLLLTCIFCCCSSRFTDSKKYEDDFMDCFQLHERRSGEICNACVLLVKRWKKLPAGSERNWRHVSVVTVVTVMISSVVSFTSTSS